MIALHLLIAQHTDQHMADVVAVSITYWQKCHRIGVIEIDRNRFVDGFAQLDGPFAAQRVRRLFGAIGHLAPAELLVALEEGRLICAGVRLQRFVIHVDGVRLVVADCGRRR